jgi:hypothetical protein
MITRRELHQLFDLNFETGELIWKKPPVNLAGKLKGTAAGAPHSEGFTRVHINGEYYPRARLIR